MAQPIEQSEISLADQYAFDCLLHWRICLQFLQAARIRNEDSSVISSTLSNSHLSFGKQLPLFYRQWNSSEYATQLKHVETVINDLKTRMTTEFNTMMLLRWELSNCLTLMFGRYAFRNPRSYTSSDRGDIKKCSAPPSNQAEIYQASSAPTMTNPSTTHATASSAYMLRCRRHRSHTCHHCAARSTDEQPLGLLKSVSAFVACSADYFVNMNGEERNNWFRILLDLQTQAIIEGYLCDNQSIFDLVQKAFLLQTQSEFKDLFQLDHEAFSNYQQAREERMDEILNINPDERYLSHLLRLNTKYKEQDTMDTLLLYIYNMYIKLETPILYQHATLSLTTLHPYQRAMLTSPILDALSLVDDLYLQCKYANPLDRLHGITTSDRHDDDDGNNNSN